MFCLEKQDKTQFVYKCLRYSKKVFVCSFVNDVRLEKFD